MTNGKKDANDRHDTHFLERLIRLEIASQSLQEKSAKPWYKDRRFWAGAGTIPAMLLGGWLMDGVFLKNDGALNMLHGAFGTQKALSDRLRIDPDYRAEVAALLAQEIDANEDNIVDALVALIPKDHYRTSLVKTLAGEIRPGEENLSEALQDSLKEVFLLQEGFDRHVDRAVRERSRILHTDVVTLGVYDLDAIQFGIVSSTAVGGCTYAKFGDTFGQGSNLSSAANVDLATCPVNYTGASSTHQSELFVVLPGQDIDISIGVSVKELDETVLLSGNHTNENLTKEVTDYDLSQIINVTLGDSKLKEFAFQGGSTRHQFGDDPSFEFGVFSSKNNSVPDGAISAGFPLRSLTFELLPGNENHLVTIALIVSHSD